MKPLELIDEFKKAFKSPLKFVVGSILALLLAYVIFVIGKCLNGECSGGCDSPVYSEGSGAVCGVLSYNSQTGEQCGVAEYNRCRTGNCGWDSKFGVKKYRAKTCRHSACGVGKYKTCQHKDFGIDKYNSCRNSSFGLKQCNDTMPWEIWKLFSS